LSFPENENVVQMLIKFMFIKNIARTIGDETYATVNEVMLITGCFDHNNIPLVPGKSITNKVVQNNAERHSTIKSCLKPNEH
jgi:hypothetical protein